MKASSATAGLTALILLVGSHSGATPPQGSRPEIDGPAAVAIAETFVRENGYTEAPALPPKRLTPESLEFEPREKWAQQRHNSLVGQAAGYLAGRRGGAKGWTVTFCYARPKTVKEPRPTGRAVTMDLTGSALQIEHVEIFLDAATTQLRDCPE